MFQKHLTQILTCACVRACVHVCAYTHMYICIHKNIYKHKIHIKYINIRSNEYLYSHYKLILYILIYYCYYKKIVSLTYIVYTSHFQLFVIF